jgi:hypothetical protein
MEIKEDVVPKTAKNFVELCKATQPGTGYSGSRWVALNCSCSLLAAA